MGVYTSVHVKRCVVSCSCVLQRGQRGVVLFVASILYRYDVLKGDLFILSCARVRRCALVSVASVLFIVGAAVCSSMTIYSQGLITEKNMVSIDTAQDYRDIVVFN